MRILILGSNGLIGNNLLRVLSIKKKFDVYGSVRNIHKFKKYLSNYNLLESPNFNDLNNLNNFFDKNKFDVVINSAGITKHVNTKDVKDIYYINSIFPKNLSLLSYKFDFKLIQISTDCVFSGKKGNYSEKDIPDSNDNYGMSKILGEDNNSKNLTIRVSTIGHELNTNFGLLNWFLSQKNECYGYSNAIFSGVTTDYLAEIFSEILIGKEISGLYHISSYPINKFKLLNIINEVYHLNLNIIDSKFLKINRSLNSSQFNNNYSFECLDWYNMIYNMKENYEKLF